MGPGRGTLENGLRLPGQGMLPNRTGSAVPPSADTVMRQRKSLVLTALLAALAAACNDDAPEATGPSPEPRNQAVTTAATTYSIKNLGTLGGFFSEALAINNVGQTV